MKYPELFREVRELLDLPLKQGQNDKVGLPGQVVRAIFKAIVDGLQRGEKVEITGFGTFTVRTRKAQKNRWFVHDPVTKGYIAMHVDQPPKKYVHFKPHGSLKTFVGVKDDGTSRTSSE